MIVAFSTVAWADAITPAEPLRAAVVDCASPPIDACYQVVRISKRTGALEVLRKAKTIGHVFVDGKFVYWSEGEIGGWSMMRLEKSSGAVTSTTRSKLRARLVRGGDGFYGFIEGDGITVLADDKPEGTIATGDRAGGEVALDDKELFWTTYEANPSLAIRSKPRRGGPVRTLAAGQWSASDLILAGDTLFWRTSTSHGSEIRSLPRGGGAAPSIVHTTGSIWALAADERDVYWVEWTAEGFLLGRVPRRGGPGQARILGVARATPMSRDNRDHIELDATHAYWNGRTTIARVAKAGGPVETVVRVARGDVQGFAVDERYIYAAIVVFGSPG